jgi:hypothetical protein
MKTIIDISPFYPSYTANEAVLLVLGGAEEIVGSCCVLAGDGQGSVSAADAGDVSLWRRPLR